MFFGGVLIIKNRGVGFELHDEVMLKTKFGVRMGFLKIGCREKKVNGFGKFREKESETRVNGDMITVS